MNTVLLIRGTGDERSVLSEKHVITLGILAIGLCAALLSVCLCCFQMSRMQAEQKRRLHQILVASHTLSRCGTSKSTTTYASVDALSTGPLSASRPGPWIQGLTEDQLMPFDTRLVCDPSTQHVRVCAADELGASRPLNLGGTSTFQPPHDYESCLYDQALE
jgi:hypothetical protein